MDIDVMGKHIHSLIAFKEKVEGMMKGSDENVARASDQLDELLRFKSVVEGALPDIGKMVQDISAVVDDVAAVKKDLAPVLEFIAERQKSDEALEAKASAAIAAAKLGSAQTTDVMRDEHPAHEPAGADKPLAHLAEVEASISAEGQPAERSESEHAAG